MFIDLNWSVCLGLEIQEFLDVKFIFSIIMYLCVSKGYFVFFIEKNINCKYLLNFEVGIDEVIDMISFWNCFQ